MSPHSPSCSGRSRRLGYQTLEARQLLAGLSGMLATALPTAPIEAVNVAQLRPSPPRDAVAEGEAGDLSVPLLLTPASGATLTTQMVTLSFQPLAGYTGNYLVRLHDEQWNGRQAAGFTHDATAHYLCLSTRQTRITVPVLPGHTYRWWVHKPGFPAASSRFSVDASAPAPPAAVVPPPTSPHAPTLLTPASGSTVDAPTVTLSFQPLAGYAGNYLVRLHDEQWNGRQAAGFTHDATAHYLCLSTRQTSITVPVLPGHTYRWWVHKPGFPAAPAASFLVSGSTDSGIPSFPSDGQIADPELIDGRYRATALQQWSQQNVDVSRVLQRWIDALPVGATLELPAGRYLVGQQIVINQRITLTSVGKSLGDPRGSESGGDCAALVASPTLHAPFGILQINQLQALHHIILDGNKAARAQSLAYQKVASGQDNRYGITARLASDDCLVEGNIFRNALGGTGLVVAPGRTGVTLRDNLFADNGVHSVRNLWADGLTVLDLSHSRIEHNVFRDNTDIDLIFGGARYCVIRGNQITHTANRGGGAFAGLMIQKWGTTSGDYTGVEITDNIVDGGPNRDIGSGIYVGSEGWYDQTPWGSLLAGQASLIHHNIVRNTQNGMYIAARQFRLFANQFSNAHGSVFRTSLGNVTSLAPIVVSPRASLIDFCGENVQPATRPWFAGQDWRGRIPNWPF